MRSPVFLFLLPLFFVFHGFAENAHYISFIDCLPLIGIYWLAAGLLYGLSWLLFRNRIKAALLASFFLSFFFFFGALHDFLRSHHIFLHRYSILLPSFAGMTLLLILYLKKQRDFARLPLFLNSLLLIYIVVDAVSLAIGTSRDPGKNASSYPQPPGTYVPCDTCSKPDIYFLLFDGYNGTKALKEAYHYDNSRLDSFLRNEGFHIQPDSRSNYFATMFSMTSMLNLSYVKNIRDQHHIGSDDFTNLFEPIRNNEVIHFLSERGYAIVNNSIFDLAGHPSPIEQPFIPTKTKLITERTLISYIERDMQKWLEQHFADPTSRGTRVYRTNQQLLARTLEESKRTAASPRFIYTHLLMPHFPHLFDSLKRMRDPIEVAREDESKSLGSYLGYIPYTNDRIYELISTIRKNTKGQAVIIFMSDHGYRYVTKDGPDLPNYFRNQNAIYLPDADYRLFHDSISAVNEFRVLFNKMFAQRLPLLKDSTVVLDFDQ